MSRTDGSSLKQNAAGQNNGHASKNGSGSAAFNGNGNGSNGNGNGNGNGNHGNSNGNGAAPEQPPVQKMPEELVFDRPVILKQTPVWALAIIGVIMGVTTFSVGWAAWAEVDEAIPAQGKLEPQGAVKDIQAPLGGVVTDIAVSEGDTVIKGQELIVFDQVASQAELDSLVDVRAALTAENRYYQAQLDGLGATIPIPENVPAGMASLTDNRAALVSENDLFRAQMTGTDLTTLDDAQRIRLQTNLAEKSSREGAARLAISQLTQQLNQVQIRLANTRQQLANAESQFLSAQGQLKRSEDGLAIDEKILNDIRPLAEEGGIANVQYLRQQQEVGTARSEVERQAAEVNNRQAEVTNQQAELLQLQQEQGRLELAVSQAEEELTNTVARSQQDPLGRIADNEKRIAEIDSQLTKLVVDNKRRISEIDGQISQSRVNLGYQVLTAPVTGKVFDMKPTGIGYVVNTNEPILKIVPEEGLIAKVFITNRDIGFVEEGMKVDVRIDSFPFSEFGDIEGTLMSIGDDALPPDQIYQFYRFPAEVQLDEQTIRVRGNDGMKEVQLQSGMSLSVNIKTRPRKVITYFTDLFSRKVDSFKSGK